MSFVKIRQYSTGETVLVDILDVANIEPAAAWRIQNSIADESVCICGFAMNAFDNSGRVYAIVDWQFSRTRIKRANPQAHHLFLKIRFPWLLLPISNIAMATDKDLTTLPKLNLPELVGNLTKIDI